MIKLENCGRTSPTMELKLYRKEAIKAVAELHYPKELIPRIKEASSNEIERIMHQARDDICEKEYWKQRGGL